MSKKSTDGPVLNDEQLQSLIDRTPLNYYTDDAEVTRSDWDALMASHRALQARLAERDAEVERLQGAMQAIVDARRSEFWGDDEPTGDSLVPTELVVNAELILKHGYKTSLPGEEVAR